MKNRYSITALISIAWIILFSILLSYILRAPQSVLLSAGVACGTLVILSLIKHAALRTPARGYALVLLSMIVNGLSVIAVMALSHTLLGAVRPSLIAYLTLYVPLYFFVSLFLFSYPLTNIKK